MHSFIFAIGIALLAQTEGQADSSKRPYWLDIAKSHIGTCQVFPTKNSSRAFQLHPEPIFHHIQNTRARSVGSVFLFVDDDGRPAAVGDVFFFPRGKKHQLYNEWHSLASEPITVNWAGQNIIAPTEPGLKWDAIPNAPTPSMNRLEFDRQLRQQARRFTAHLINRSNDKYELRLLTRPLYEYGAKQKVSPDEETKEAQEKAIKTEPVGGGFFAFCQETDPEIFLLIETQKNSDTWRWMYAAAEFSNLNLFMQLDGKQVWSADPPRFSSTGPHTGGHLTDVDLEAPK